MHSGVSGGFARVSCISSGTRHDIYIKSIHCYFIMFRIFVTIRIVIEMVLELFDDFIIDLIHSYNISLLVAVVDSR